MSDDNKEEYFYIEMVYKPKKDNSSHVCILGKAFVFNNKNNCKIIYKDKKYELKQLFEHIDYNYNHKDEIKIKLKINKNITDMSYLFS